MTRRAIVQISMTRGGEPVSYWVPVDGDTEREACYRAKLEREAMGGENIEVKFLKWSPHRIMQRPEQSDPQGKSYDQDQDQESQDRTRDVLPGR